MKEKSVITIEAKEAIRKNIAELKEVLKDDKEFAQELVDSILSLGQGVYYDTILSLIHCSKYNVINDYRDPQYSKNIGIITKLSSVWDSFWEIMEVKKFYNKAEIDALPEDDYIEYVEVLCDNVKDEIYDAFYENNVESLNVADMNLMGE